MEQEWATRNVEDGMHMERSNNYRPQRKVKTLAEIGEYKNSISDSGKGQGTGIKKNEEKE